MPRKMIMTMASRSEQCPTCAPGERCQRCRSCGYEFPHLRLYTCEHEHLKTAPTEELEGCPYMVIFIKVHECTSASEEHGVVPQKEHGVVPQKGTG